jgi:3-hydroxypropanoate dehydrogenase
MAFDALPARDLPVSDAVLAQLFTEARTRNGWSDRPVSEDLIRKLYDLTKFGPTAVNMTPARFVFITSPEAKARLSTHMAEGNRAKSVSTVIVEPGEAGRGHTVISLTLRVNP